MPRKPTPAKITKWEKTRRVKKLLESKQVNDENIVALAEKALSNVLNSFKDDLYSCDEKTMKKAVKTVGKFKYLQSAAGLRFAYNNSNERLRKRIVWALGELPDRDAVKLIEEYLLFSKWGINPSLSRQSIAEKALKKIDTMRSKLVLKSFKNRCKTEQEARARGQIFTCPICKTNISMLAIGCHKCKKVFEKRNWISKWVKDSPKKKYSRRR